MDQQRLGDNLQHLHAWIQGGVGILENGLHLPAQAVQLGARSPRHIDAVHADAALGGFHQPQNHPRQRRLARAGFAHQPQCLAGLNPERNVFDDGALLRAQPHPPGIALPTRIHLNQRHGLMVYARRASQG